MGKSLWGCKELDMTEPLGVCAHVCTYTQVILVYESRGPWRVTVMDSHKPWEMGDSKASGEADSSAEHILTWILGDQVLTQFCQ